MANNSGREEGDDHIVSVKFVLGKDLKEEVRNKNGIKENEYAEIRVMNSEPHIIIEKVDSPSSKVLQVLNEHNIDLGSL